MKRPLILFFTLALLCSCDKQPTTKQEQNKNEPLANNISKADHVKSVLIIPALDALSYQLEKAGYDTNALNQINKYLKENSVDNFLKNNEVIKEVEKVIENGNNKPIEKKSSFHQQDVFETF